MKQNLAKETFIEKAKKVHGDKYDYSKVQIINSKSKVVIICKKHGEFLQEANSHLQGRGCPYCSGKKFSFQDYLEKANKVWNNKYDYSKFEWKGVGSKVCIICPEHGEFWQLPNNHLKGECGCLECRGKSKDFKPIQCLDDVITQAKQKFGDKFDFSESVWGGSRNHLKIICPEHGEFSTYPRQFLLNKCGCPECNSGRKYTTEEYIKAAKKFHQDWDYDYSKVVYKKSTEPVEIICKKHGSFFPIASNFLSGGCNCIKCVQDSYRLTKEEFIKRAKEIHGDYYNYDKVNYVNQITPITITCPKHGDFEQLPGNHLKGCNCKKCARENLVPSHGEELVQKILNKYNISYKVQYEIKTKKLARNSNIIIVDIALKHNNKVYFIEYNGKQHYEYIPFFFKTQEDFQAQLRRDQLLREICEKNSDKVTLIEIKYTLSELEVENLIKNILNLK